MKISLSITRNFILFLHNIFRSLDFNVTKQKCLPKLSHLMMKHLIIIITNEKKKKYKKTKERKSSSHMQ